MNARTITLVAKQPLTYAGRELQAGDVFSAKPIDAAMLTYRRRANFAPTDAPVTPEPEQIKPSATVNIGFDVGDGQVEQREIDAEVRPRRRRYRRRDMKAEE